MPDTPPPTIATSISGDDDEEDEEVDADSYLAMIETAVYLSPPHEGEPEPLGGKYGSMLF
jgi:hypothetical protein